MFEKLFRYDMFAYVELHRAFTDRGRSAKVGQKLLPTKWAIENGVLKESDRGVLVGYGRSSSYIRVRKGKNKTAYSYWAGFWMPK